VSVDGVRNGDELLAMRDYLGGRCRANVFVNRTNLRDATTNDINMYVRPSELLGVEVYTGIGAPPSFSAQNGCGSVAFWTR
jgi:hypothetical protein